MRENENTRIHGRKTILTPYEAFHVPKYHKWMESEILREETASERLTLEEEYEMQLSWRSDPDKAMVGDVNIFYYDEDSLEKTGEIEIMIAEPGARGKGMGREALQDWFVLIRSGVFPGRIRGLMEKVLSSFKSLHSSGHSYDMFLKQKLDLDFICESLSSLEITRATIDGPPSDRNGQKELKTEKFISKIGLRNEVSLKLFKSLGFKEISRSEAFKEVTLSVDVKDPNLLLPYTPDYSLEVINI